MAAPAEARISRHEKKKKREAAAKNSQNICEKAGAKVTQTDAPRPTLLVVRNARRLFGYCSLPFFFFLLLLRRSAFLETVRTPRVISRKFFPIFVCVLVRRRPLANIYMYLGYFTAA